MKLDRQSLSQGNETYPFRIGMGLEGRIITHHESMLMHGVRKLLGVSDDVGADADLAH
ncbi:MAG: hypothetical protein R3C68_13335 [Myxococcota bacterium]